MLEALKKRISRMRKGERFSTELELCKEFNVSRMTANKVIKSLESEGLLKRIQGSGTYVDKPEGNKSIKFLLPCQEYVVYDCTYPLRLVLYGAQKEAEKQGRVLEGIWVSPSNSPDDIALSQFDDFDSESKVVVYSRWFQKTFDILKKRKCKTALLNTQDLDNGMRVPEDWSLLSIDIPGSAARAVDYLSDNSRKNIAVVHSFKENNHPIKKTIEKALKRNKRKTDYFFQCETPDSLERVATRLLEPKNKKNIDSILIVDNGYAGSFMRLLTSKGVKVPDEMSILTLGDSEWLLNQPISAMGIPYVKIGREAVKSLCEEGGAETKIFKTKLTIRESTEKGSGARVDSECFPEPPKKTFI
jgi:DNA-binding LacI/PurR family transcriptional regulator